MPDSTAQSEFESDREEESMVRMSFGDHLEELRRCLIRSFIGIGIGMGVAFAFARGIQSFLCRPLSMVKAKYGEPLNIMVLGPADYFLNWLKIVFIAGLILAMPWVLYQIWAFVSAGLYSYERRWVKRFAPISVGLFVLGTVFLYYVVLPIVLNFFVTFNRQFTVPDAAPNALERVLIGMKRAPEPRSDGVAGELAKVPMLDADPVSPEVGSMWINRSEGRLKFETDQGRYTVPLDSGSSQQVVANNFAIREYMSFVLSLILAFGIAFELPLVVLFLAVTGIVSISAMAKARRYVIISIFALAAILTPPDVLSQILLAIPMWLLFEGGLLMSRWIERKRDAYEPSSEDSSVPA